MKKSLLPLLSLLALTACGGAPASFVPGGGTDPEIELPDGLTGTNGSGGALERYEARDGNGGGYAEDIRYDKDKDEFFVDNLAFDVTSVIVPGTVLVFGVAVLAGSGALSLSETLLLGFLGGILGDIDIRLPFWVAGGLALLNAAYGMFVLPESLPPERRAPFEWRRANPLASLKMLRAHPGLFGLAGVSFLMALAHLVYPTTFVLYADYRFGWGLEMVGWTLLLVGVLTVIVQGGLVGRIARTFGDRRTVLIGATAGGLGFAMYALAPNGYWFWAAMPVAALWAVAGPAAQSLMTARVSPSEQGRLQGAIGSLNSIAGILGPTLFTQTLAFVAANELRGPMAGASFWLAAVMVSLGGLLAWRVTTTRP